MPPLNAMWHCPTIDLPHNCSDVVRNERKSLHTLVPIGACRAKPVDFSRNRRRRRIVLVANVVVVVDVVVAGVVVVAVVFVIFAVAVVSGGA